MNSAPANADDLLQLKLLSIFHYVVAGIMALFSLMPVIHVVVGVLMLTGVLDDPNAGEELSFVLGLVFVIFPLVLIVLGMTLAVCLAVAGRRLARQEHYTFCLVMAAVACIFMPVGTVLGVFTIIVLNRPSVKALFGAAATTGESGEAN